MPRSSDITECRRAGEFPNEGQRPQTRPQAMDMVKNARELQHPEKQLWGPQTWYPLETSISSLVKRKNGI